LKNNNFKIFPEINIYQKSVEELYDKVFGRDRYSRTVYSLRSGKKITELCFIIKNDRDEILACIRFWLIKIGLQSGILLGPLAVKNDFRGHGLGSMLINHSLNKARLKNFNFCFVSGEEDYYPKFGFQKIASSKLILPGYIDPKRLHIIFFKKEIIDLMGAYPWKVIPQN
tara:strand:+ start:1133 stop:1642 length:510 start_codon:yes stop_codon:yes gene_type:complete